LSSLLKHSEKKWLVIIAVILLSGCISELPLQIAIRLPSICPGKDTRDDAIAAVKAHSESIIPLKANGECNMRYYTEDGKQNKERFPIKVRVFPPNRIYIQGGPLFMPRAIVLGANEREFWAWLKPEKMSTYWWGRFREMENCVEVIDLNPYNVMQALGVVKIENNESWSLYNKGIFDVLEKQAPNGNKIQRIYISCCDYMVRRIEYFDEKGHMVLITMLEQYRRTKSGFLAPRTIKIVRSGKDNKNDFINIKLRSIQPEDFSKEQLNVIFSRPEPKGFEHVYKIGQNCELIGQ